MAKRKQISKKVRFEVFKRDKFQCQYCGRVSPDVVLHVDHIHPVIEGGDNSIMNLVTSCQDCNLGKGKRVLSNEESLKKSYKQVVDLSERREQLEMMMEWRNLSINMEKSNYDYYIGILLNEYSYDLDLNDKKEISQIKRSLKKYGLDHLLTCTEKVADKHYISNNDTINEYSFIKDIRMCCYWEIENKNNPKTKIPYIAGILNKKFGSTERMTLDGFRTHVNHITNFEIYDGDNEVYGDMISYLKTDTCKTYDQFLSRYNAERKEKINE